MNSLNFRGVTMTLIDVTLAAGTTTTIGTTGTTHYSIDGLAYTHAAASNLATPTLDVNTGVAFIAVQPSEASVFVLGYNAAGDLKVAQGDIVPTDGHSAGASATLPRNPNFPSLPEDFCPFGYIVTKVGASGAAWTFGASNLAGPPSNVLHTFNSICVLPDRPQAS